MLVLSRRVHEKIVFPGLNVAVQVVGVKGGVVRVGVEAPPEIQVLRGEVQARRAEWEGPAPATKPAAEDRARAAEERLAQLRELVRRRLEVGRKGLAVLGGQLDAGLGTDAAETLAKVDEDLELLLRRLDPPPPAPARGKPAEKPRAKPARTALLVEDNPAERELMAQFLRNAGLDVATASDGADALDYLHRRGQPDVVFLDMGLPRTDGAEVVRTVRRDPAYAGLKIFAVTGHGPEEFDLAEGPSGVDRWYHKPVDPADLVRGMNQELNHAALCRP